LAEWWKLDKEIFKRICAQLGLYKMNLFATRLNHQLGNDVSWRPNPGAMRTNFIHWYCLSKKSLWQQQEWYHSGEMQDCQLIQSCHPLQLKISQKGMTSY